MNWKWKTILGVLFLEALIPAYAAGWPPDYVLCKMPSEACDIKFCPGVFGEHAELFIESDGTIVWNGERLDQKKLMAYAADAGKRQDQVQFIIWPRVDTSYGKVASLLKLLQKSGVKRVACAVPEK